MSLFNVLTRSKVLGFAFFAIPMSLILGGCSSGGSGGTTPPPPPPVAATPTINLTNNTTYTTAQTLTVTAAGETVHCTLDGTTPTVNSAPCPSTSLSVNGTTVIKAYASVAGDTDSAVVSATIIINIPVTPTISVPATFSMNIDESMLTTAVVTCFTGTCDFSKMTVTVTPVTTDTAHADGCVFANWTFAAGFTGGNCIPEDKSNTFKVHAVLGTSTADSVLTINIPAPGINTVTPAVMPASISGARVITFHSSHVAASSATQTLDQFLGSLGLISYGSCPTGSFSKNMLAGITWLDPNTGSQGTGSTLTPGSWSSYFLTDTTASGTGGGQNCNSNDVMLTASGTTVFGSGLHASVATLNFVTGELSITGATTATFNLGSRADSLLTTADGLYAISPSHMAITKIDPSSKSLTSVPTGDYTPKALVAVQSTGAVYFAGDLTSDLLSKDKAHNEHPRGAIFSVASGYVTKVADANGYRSLSISGTKVLWTADSADGESTALNVLEPESNTVTHMTIADREAGTVVGLTPTIALVYTGGGKDATVVDLSTMQVIGTVPFAKGIMHINADGLAALADGNVGTAAIVVDGSGKPSLSWTPFAQTATPEDLFHGFAKEGNTLHVARPINNSLVPLAIHGQSQQ